MWTDTTRAQHARKGHSLPSDLTSARMADAADRRCDAVSAMRRLACHDRFSGSMVPTRATIASAVGPSKSSSTASIWSRFMRAATTPLMVAAEDGIRSKANCATAIEESLIELPTSAIGYLNFCFGNRALITLCAITSSATAGHCCALCLIVDPKRM